MPPFMQLLSRFDPGVPSGGFLEQWRNPGEVFSVLLILGGDVVARALAQLVGSGVTPVAFSFGWVAYAVTAVVSAVGENKLMPLPDCSCKVINGKTGYVRENRSWIIGRIVRDFDTWMDLDDPNRPIQTHLNKMIQNRWDRDRDNAEKRKLGSGKYVKRPVQASLCVSIYKAQTARPGYPGYDLSYYVGFVTAIIQLGIAAIPCGAFGEWGMLLVTVAGILLSFITGSIPQWREEKWACRVKSDKTVILTRGNGSQHAIVILGARQGLDFEDLAAGPARVGISISYTTRITIIILAALWILLLITAAGIKKNTWFLLSIGGLGILQNSFVAGWKRVPKAYGVPLTFKAVYGEDKAMKTLFAVEKDYPRVGKSMQETFFPGKLRANEVQNWAEFEKIADDKDAAEGSANVSTAAEATSTPATNQGSSRTTAACTIHE